MEYIRLAKFSWQQPGKFHIILRSNNFECLMEHLLTGSLFNYGDIIIRCFLIMFYKVGIIPEQ